MHAPFSDLLEQTALLHKSIFSWGIDYWITRETFWLRPEATHVNIYTKPSVLCQDAGNYTLTGELHKIAVLSEMEVKQ